MKPVGSSHPVERGVDVEIERLAAGGLGVARHEGRVLLVPRVCPSELVHVTLGSRDRRATIEPRVLEVRRASPDRVEPECPKANACGGCDLMHIRADQQLGHLANVVADLLRHATGREIAVHRTSAPHATRYRTRARLAFESHASKRGDTVLIGYRPRRSRELVAIDACLVLDARLERALEVARSVLTGSKSAGELLIGLGHGQLPVIELKCESDLLPVAFARIEALVRGSADVARSLAGARVWLPDVQTPLQFGDPRLVQTAADGPDLVFAPGSFAQPSDASAQLLSARVIAARDRLLRNETRRAAARVVELFCGNGTLTVELVRGVRSLVGIEVDKAACASARMNLEARGLSAAITTADAENCPIPACELVVLDPPRTGAKGAIANIVKARPKSVLYVSCDPTTLARDVATLVKAGYSVDSAEVVELFPQTSHVETIVALQRGAPQSNDDGGAG